jgi:hypothetical protein
VNQRWVRHEISRVKSIRICTSERSRMEDRHKGKSVREIMESFSPQWREVAEMLRALMKKTLPKCVETVKWGNITYVQDDKNLAWIIAYKDHLDFGFFRGAQLESKRLEGTGKGLRHIKIRAEEDIDEKEFARLIKDAAKLG